MAGRRGFGGAAVGLAVIGMLALGVVQWFRSSPASTPSGFSEGVSLVEVESSARRDGKLVLAVATADWCGPCQSYKRGGLADEEVRAWVDANAVAVLIDVDESPGDAEMLGVRGVPTTFLIRDREVIGRFVGARSGEELRSWLAMTARAAEIGEAVESR